MTSYIRNSKHFSKLSIKHSNDLSKLRWTVDEIDDLNVIKNVFNHFSPNIYFNWHQILKLQKTNPKLFSDNNDIKINEGSNIGTGQKLYKRAKKIIPGGNMLLSKRPEMFLPEKWPAYLAKRKAVKFGILMEMN